MKVYGPYLNKKTGRLFVNLIDRELGLGTTVSYPKYIAQRYLNYELKDNETVDHIDNDYLNNELSNLRIIDRSEHNADDALRLVTTFIPCVWCNTPVGVTGKNRTFKRAGPFCSRSCSGKYGSAVQNGVIDKFEPFIPTKKYYRRKHLIELESIVDVKNKLAA